MQTISKCTLGFMIFLQTLTLQTLYADYRSGGDGSFLYPKWVKNTFDGVGYYRECGQDESFESIVVGDLTYQETNNKQREFKYNLFRNINGAVHKRGFAGEANIHTRESLLEFFILISDNVSMLDAGVRNFDKFEDVEKTIQITSLWKLVPNNVRSHMVFNFSTQSGSVTSSAEMGTLAAPNNGEQISEKLEYTLNFVRRDSSYDTETGLGLAGGWDWDITIDRSWPIAPASMEPYHYTASSENLSVSPPIFNPSTTTRLGWLTWFLGFPGSTSIIALDDFYEFSQAHPSPTPYGWNHWGMDYILGELMV